MDRWFRTKHLLYSLALELVWMINSDYSQKAADVLRHSPNEHFADGITYLARPNLQLTYLSDQL